MARQWTLSEVRKTRELAELICKGEMSYYAASMKLSGVGGINRSFEAIRTRLKTMCPRIRQRRGENHRFKPGNPGSNTPADGLYTARAALPMEVRAAKYEPCPNCQNNTEPAFKVIGHNTTEWRLQCRACSHQKSVTIGPR